MGEHHSNCFETRVERRGGARFLDVGLWRRGRREPVESILQSKLIILLPPSLPEQRHFYLHGFKFPSPKIGIQHECLRKARLHSVWQCFQDLFASWKVTLCVYTYIPIYIYIYIYIYTYVYLSLCQIPEPRAQRSLRPAVRGC